MRQTTRHFEWLMMLTALAWVPAAMAAPANPAPAPVEVTIRFPGDARTTANVYAREVGSGALITGRVEAGEPRLVMKLPPGRYWLFAEPDDPGVPDLLGAHTEWSVCQAQPPGGSSTACDSHAMAVFVVERTAATKPVIDDWYLPTAIVRELEQSLRRNPDRPDDLELGAPRFSEYPARVLTPATVFHFDPASHPEGAQWESAVNAAAARGVNFAGHWLVVANACGDTCSNYALIEWASGRIFVPDALRAVSSALPCKRAQPVQHRADSRLITVTQPDDRNVVTRYYLWDEAQGSLTEMASYRASAQRYCERD
jgi:hypothetical protein